MRFGEHGVVTCIKNRLRRESRNEDSILKRQYYSLIIMMQKVYGHFYLYFE